MSSKKTILIQAHLDGELDTATTAALQDEMEESADAHRIEHDFLLARRLAKKVTRHAAPEGLRRDLQTALRREVPQMRSLERWFRSVWLVPAALGCVVLVAGLVWHWPASSARGDTLLNEVAIAGHVRSLQATSPLMVASSDQHTVKPWFAGKLDYSPPVVNMATRGYPLLGGRLDYLAQRTVACLVYGRRKHVISVFVWPDQGAATPKFTQVRGYNVADWRDAGFHYVAVSDLNAAELQSFTRLVLKVNGER